MKIQGIDISKWQGNWEATVAKSAGSSFVFIKASQSKYTDPQFFVNWQKAVEVELTKGAYHFLDYSISGAEQADYFADILDRYPCELAPVVDFEKRVPNHGRWPIEFLRDFVEQMLGRGYSPIVYTSPDFWLTFGENNEYWAQFPLWLAHYTDGDPQVPAPWKNWAFWQYTENGSGKEFGAESFDINLDYFNGSLEDLYGLPPIEAQNAVDEDGNLMQRLQIVEETISHLVHRITQIEQKKKDLKAVCKTRILNVRQGPGPLYPLAGELLDGQQIKVLARKNGWAHIENPNGWAKEKYLAYTTQV